jgi:hypothetical protein
VRIGRERLRQLLHERGISFQRTRTWKESTDPDRDAKLDRIEYVTSACPDRCFASGHPQRTPATPVPPEVLKLHNRAGARSWPAH